MGGVKKPKMPSPSDPVPTPVQLEEEVLEKERSRRRQRLRQFGRGGTILTQGGLGVSQASQKGTLLGGET